MTTTEDAPAENSAGSRHPRTRQSLETSGLTHLPHTGGAVLALTHFAHHELAMVELAVWRHSRRRIRSLVLNGRVEEPEAGRLFRPLRRIFVDLTVGPSAYDEPLDALRDGELVALFPEAGSGASSAVRELRIGAARLAVEANVPLIPVAVWCDPPAQPRRNHGSRVSGQVAFGAPIPMQRSEDVRAVTDELRATLQRMIFGMLLDGQETAGPQPERSGQGAEGLASHRFPAYSP